MPPVLLSLPEPRRTHGRRKPRLRHNSSIPGWADSGGSRSPGDQSRHGRRSGKAAGHGSGRVFGTHRIVRRITRRAGIAKRVGPHTLRHAFITAALDAARTWSGCLRFNSRQSR
jgi:integrase